MCVQHLLSVAVCGDRPSSAAGCGAWLGWRAAGDSVGGAAGLLCMLECDAM